MLKLKSLNNNLSSILFKFESIFKKKSNQTHYCTLFIIKNENVSEKKHKINWTIFK